jgi:hypothetical protein
MLWWWQESESRGHTALSNFGCLSGRGRCWRWCEWNANGWLRTFRATTQTLFQFRFEIWLAWCALKASGAEKSPC